MAGGWRGPWAGDLPLAVNEKGPDENPALSFANLLALAGVVV